MIEWIDDGGCIRCISHKPDNGGYLRVFRKGRNWLFHRLILQRRNPYLPDDVISRHTCDNRWCIRPDHLLEGTDHDNKQDAVSRNRHAYGERAGRAKLTAADVAEIRSRHGQTQREIAREFGVDHSQIQRIRAGITWSRK